MIVGAILRASGARSSRAFRLSRFVGFTLVVMLAACAQPLGGTNGDPTVAARDRAVEPARASRVVQAMAKHSSTEAESPASNEPAAATAPADAPALQPRPAQRTERQAADDAPPGASRIARVVRVGPDGNVATIAAAARLARDGDTVEVQAGEYHGDVAVWTQKRLRIRSVGGRAVLRADGRAAEGKAIWVLRNGHFEIDGFDFVGTRVPSRNGAGIRFEHGKLVVRNSRFLDNQMGLLTGNDPQAELIIERCEFTGPKDGDHWYHNLYVGRIARFEMTDSVSRDARVGHLVKSRARVNVVSGNRLGDGAGTASYELEFPEGGIAIVRGNTIEQSPRTENPVVVSFGAEGYRWSRNELRMTGNTLVNRAGSDASFVRVAPGDASASLSANTWVGEGRLQVPDGSDGGTNRVIPLHTWTRTSTR
jgi:hypothetical protein